MPPRPTDVPEPRAALSEVSDGRVQSGKIVRIVGDRHQFGGKLRRPVPIRVIATQDKVRSVSDRLLDFAATRLHSRPQAFIAGGFEVAEGQLLEFEIGRAHV